MNIDKLKAVTDIYCHASCPDGLASAMICAASFALIGMKPKIWFIQYGTEKMATLEARPGQLFADITPPVPRWEEWKAVSPIVLDHHMTSRHVTEGLGGVYGTTVQSGATLAFEHVMKPFLEASGASVDTSWEDVAKLSAIRDTWQDSDQDWDAAVGLAHELMDNNPYTMVDAARAGTLDFEKLRAASAKAGEKIDFKSRKLAESAYFESVMYRGVSYLFGTFNCTEKLISDAANMLLRHGCDVAISYFMLCEDGAPRISVSLRTKGEISARALAETLKGGGHERAAGFRMNDGLNASVHNIVRTVAGAVYSMPKGDGAIQPDDGRVRFTGAQVVESLQTLKKKSAARPFVP